MNLAIFNARYNSTRFPGKLMQELWNGKSVLEMFLDRMKTVRAWDQMVLAVQNDPSNQPLLDVAMKLGVETFLSERPPLANGAEDVLGRTKDAADHFHANTVIRVTPDCPAIHRDVIHRACIAYYMNKNGCHYVSNCWHRGDGLGFPRGAEVEVISYAAIMQSEDETRKDGDHKQDYYREHVTTFIRRFPRLFGIADVPPSMAVVPGSSDGRPMRKANEAMLDDKGKPLGVRLTLDYPEDLEVLRNVFRELQDKVPAESGYFDLNEIADLAKSKPELFKANQHIEQRG